MNFRLFILVAFLLTIPVFSISQSLENPLGQMENSVHDIVKDFFFYAMLILLVIGVIIFLIKKTLNTTALLLVLGSLVFLIVWFMI